MKKVHVWTFQEFVLIADLFIKNIFIAKHNLPITFNLIIKVGPLPTQHPHTPWGWKSPSLFHICGKVSYECMYIPMLLLSFRALEFLKQYIEWDEQNRFWVAGGLWGWNFLISNEP